MRRHKTTQLKQFLKKAWDFIWNDDSILSWAINVVLAFILIKFIVYPFLALLLGTQLPIVAVISESMSHTPTPLCEQRSLFTGDCVVYSNTGYEICSDNQDSNSKLNFDDYWLTCGDWYEGQGITKEEFSTFSLNNGFEKGDVIVLTGANPETLEVGDILVFQSNIDLNKSRPYPIIHRIVKIQDTNNGKIFSTKGDHNGYQILTTTFNENEISESQIRGKGVAKIPFVGYVKLIFVDFLELIGLM